MAHLADHGRVATRRASGESTKECQDEVRRAVEAKQSVTAFEVAGFGLRRPRAVLDTNSPLAAPGSGDVDPVREVLPGGLLLVHLVLPEDEGEGQDQTGRRLLDGGQLVAEPVLDVVRVNAVVHDLERA